MPSIPKFVDLNWLCKSSSDIACLLLTISTNYPQQKVLVGGWQTRPAVMLLDGRSNGTGWNYMISLADYDGFIAGRLHAIIPMCWAISSRQAADTGAITMCWFG